MSDTVNIGGEMAASYVVTIDGVQRTAVQIKALDDKIKQIRAGRYTAATNVTEASDLGSKDLLVTKFNEFSGQIQTGAQKAMVEAMDEGKDLQGQFLRGAFTTFGEERFARNDGNGPGRDREGDMIDAIKRGVEMLRKKSVTIITGFHGWSTEDRKRYFTVQEKGSAGRNSHSPTARRKGHKQKGNGGVPAANSLGATIPMVRESLKSKLRELEK